MGRQKIKSYDKELKEVYDFINEKFRVNIADKVRSNHYVDLRVLYFKMSLDYTLASTTEIAKLVNRDYSTLIHARTNLFDYTMSKKHIQEAYNEFFGIENKIESSMTTLTRLREIAETKRMEKINNAGLTKNEIAYRKLTDSQKSVYDERASLILKSFGWKEYNSTFETINVGISTN